MKNRIETLIKFNKRKKGIRIFVGVFMVMLLSLVGCNGSSQPIEEGNNTLEYYHESLGYVITLPDSVKDRVIIQEQDNTVYISSKLILEDGSYPGIILFINPISKSEYPERQDLDNYIENEAPVSFVVIGETENDYICYNFASDVQYPPGDETLTKEYNDLINEFMNNDFDVVIKE